MADNTKLLRLLDKNSHKNFIQRIFLLGQDNPDRDKQPFLLDEGGRKMTHRMSAEVDDSGNWLVFPTVYWDDKAKHLKQDADNYEGMKRSIEMDDYLSFGKDKDAALSFASGGYKDVARWAEEDK